MGWPQKSQRAPGDFGTLLGVESCPLVSPIPALPLAPRGVAPRGSPVSPPLPQHWQSASAVTAAVGPATCPPPAPSAARNVPSPWETFWGRGRGAGGTPRSPLGIPLHTGEGTPWILLGERFQSHLWWLWGPQKAAAPWHSGSAHPQLSWRAGGGGTAWRGGASTYGLSIGAGRARAEVTWSGPGFFLLKKKKKRKRTKKNPNPTQPFLANQDQA